MARPPRVLAVASGGGHWVQLQRLRPAFEGCDTLWVTVSEDYVEDVEDGRFTTVPDATRWNKLGVLRLALSVLWIVVRERPDVVVTTGAAPGFFAVVFGKILRARTVWIDSVANVEVLSGSGSRVSRFADLWLTQWPHLAREGGPEHEGAVF